jgi:hypothetical protein
MEYKYIIHAMTEQNLFKLEFFKKFQVAIVAR